MQPLTVRYVNILQYNVPTGEEEENAIASRALHGNKGHKDFSNCEILNSHYFCIWRLTYAL